MTMPIRPFRFGIQAKSAPPAAAEWVELARRVEGNGYSTLGLPDHFDDQLAPVPALQCAADATSTLRLGALVYDNDYKHPIVLAKELATMDVLSDGRVQIGLGAGWTATDYEQSGIPYDPPGVRISRMIEGGLDHPVGARPARRSVRRRALHDHELHRHPKPVQIPMPFLIGGGGPRLLAIRRPRGRHRRASTPRSRRATIDQSTFDSMTAEAVDEKVGRRPRRRARRRSARTRSS